MSTIEQRTAYLQNPFFLKPLYGDFSSFYATIAVCTVFGVLIIALNIICGCCSKHKQYWQDRHTGNRWLVSIWSATPHNQPPLDLTELKDSSKFHQIKPAFYDIEAAPIHTTQEYPSQQQYPSAPQQQPQRQQRPIRPSRSQSPQQREEYVELQKRESDI